MTKTYLLMVISEESVCLTSSLTPLTADLAGTVCKVSHSSIADERQPTEPLPRRTGTGKVAS